MSSKNSLNDDINEKHEENDKKQNKKTIIIIIIITLIVIVIIAIICIVLYVKPKNKERYEQNSVNKNIVEVNGHYVDCTPEIEYMNEFIKTSKGLS